MPSVELEHRDTGRETEATYKSCHLGEVINFVHCMKKLDYLLPYWVASSSFILFCILYLNVELIYYMWNCIVCLLSVYFSQIEQTCG